MPYSPLFVRCPICHQVFKSSVSRETLTTSVPKSHFEKVHPEYNQWRRRFTWKLILGTLSPLIAIVPIGLVWGFSGNLNLYPQGEILLLSFLPVLTVFVRLSLVNRQFRHEWIATHGD